MSYSEYAWEFYQAQERKTGQYYMFMIDVIDSKQLYYKPEYQNWTKLVAELNTFCKVNKTIKLQQSYREDEDYYFILGDAVGVAIDLNTTSLEDFQVKWKEFYESYGIDFHIMGTYFETLDYKESVGRLESGYAFRLLEDLSKDKRWYCPWWEYIEIEEPVMTTLGPWQDNAVIGKIEEVIL